MSDTESDYSWSSDEDDTYVDVDEWNTLIEYSDNLEATIQKLEESKIVAENEKKETLAELNAAKKESAKIKAILRDRNKELAMRNYEIHRLYEQLRQDVIKLHADYEHIRGTITIEYDQDVPIPAELYALVQTIYDQFYDINEIYSLQNMTIYEKYSMLQEKVANIRLESQTLQGMYRDFIIDLQENGGVGSTDILNKLEPLHEDFQVLNSDFGKIDETVNIPGIEESKEEKDYIQGFFERIAKVTGKANELLTPPARLLRNTNSILISAVGIAAFFGIVISRKK